MGNHSSKHDLDLVHVAEKKRNSLVKGWKSMKSLGKDRSVPTRRSISRLDLLSKDSDALAKLGQDGRKKERGSSKQRRASRRSLGNLELTETLAVLDGSFREPTKGRMASRRKSDSNILGKLDLSERLELLDGSSVGTIAKRRRDSIHKKKERRRSDVFPSLNLSGAAASSLELSQEVSVADNDFNTMITNSMNDESFLSKDISAQSTNEQVERQPKPVRRVSLRRLDPASVSISSLDVPAKKKGAKAKRRNTDGFRLDLSHDDFAALCESFENDIRAESSSTTRPSSTNRRRSSGFRLNLNSINFADLDLSELGTCEDEEPLVEVSGSTEEARPQAMKDSMDASNKKMTGALPRSRVGSCTHHSCNSKACSAA